VWSYSTEQGSDYLGFELHLSEQLGLWSKMTFLYSDKIEISQLAQTKSLTTEGTRRTLGALF